MKRLVILAVLAALLLAPGLVSATRSQQMAVETVTVTEIIDGDTIDVLFDDGQTERVRYIGVNTPEEDDPCYSEARNANTELVLGQEVIMIQDVSNWDSSGRLLRYVFIGGTFVNAELVAGGWAEAVEYPPDVIFASYFEHLEQQARAADLGCHPSGVFADAASQTAPAAAPVQAEGVTVSTSKQINLRTGPGTDYPVQRTLAAGSANVAAVGRNTAGDWLVLEDGAWVAAWVVAVSGDVASLPIQEAPPAPAAASPKTEPISPPPVSPAQQPELPSRSSCNCGKACTQMASCEEAYYQLQTCGCSERDSDGDGIPCESICPGG